MLNMTQNQEKIKSLLELIAQGENSSIEFKRVEVCPESLAKELVAFSNTTGGVVLIGVDDHGQIIGTQTRTNMEEWVANVVRNNIIPAICPQIESVQTDGKTVIVIQVDKGPDKPYQTIDGKYWLRVGSTNRMATKEELRRLFQQAGLVHYDIAPVEGTELSDLDERKLNDYWQDYYGINYRQLEEPERLKLLLNADILTEHEQIHIVTVGGLLIFGFEPQKRLWQSAITFAVFDGIDLTEKLLDKQEVIGTLPDLIRQTTTKIRFFLPRSSTILGLQREEKTLIPEKVIREALVNAVCHRDYSIANRRITVYLFRDRLEITSPGRLPNTLTIEKILTGNSAPRNTFILKYLDNMKFIDGLGRGVPMIHREMGNRFLYKEEGELLRLSFFLEP
jgi:ATP-dependent DNA helicase RecG